MSVLTGLLALCASACTTLEQPLAAVAGEEERPVESYYTQMWMEVPWHGEGYSWLELSENRVFSLFRTPSYEPYDPVHWGISVFRFPYSLPYSDEGRERFSELGGDESFEEEPVFYIAVHTSLNGWENASRSGDVQRAERTVAGRRAELSAAEFSSFWSEIQAVDPVSAIEAAPEPRCYTTHSPLFVFDVISGEERRWSSVYLGTETVPAEVYDAADAVVRLAKQAMPGEIELLDRLYDHSPAASSSFCRDDEASA
ncbi:MAG: hypothetical protein AAF830_08040 [Pseudomonadota bacterium]